MAKLGDDIDIDIGKLVESRMLIQANSGGGKSWAIRRLLEQTYSGVQQILIDTDGEFHTLREKFDYVLAGKGGDCPADIKSASLLARRLLELKVSAIIDIYELGTQRAEFVKRFLDSLVNAPRELWHPVLVVVDEAHTFCPEQGSAVSANAVKDLMTLGRKRGFCGVLATQRISKLHKDAAAEANNKLVGRSSLDIDMKRASAELGFTSKADTLSLRTLKPGEFYAFGPAISSLVKIFKVGPVKTTHLRAGQRSSLPSAPSVKIKKLLGQLADLPHEAEEEAKSVGELRTQIKSLKIDLKKAQSAQKTETKTVEKLVLKASQIKEIETLLKKAEKTGGVLHSFNRDFTALLEHFDSNVSKFHGAISLLGLAVRTARDPVPAIPKADPKIDRVAAASLRNRNEAHPPRKLVPKSEASENQTELPPGEAMILRVLIQFPEGLRREQISVLTTYKLSTRNAYISRLKDRGLVDSKGSLVIVTEDGKAFMPDAEPLPTGEALREHWYRELPPGECAVLKLLINNYPNAVNRDYIDEVTEFKLSTRNAYLSRLTAKQLVISEGRGEVKASPTLFDT